VLTAITMQLGAIRAAHADGILVCGSPITPTNQGDATIRAEVNEWIRTRGLSGERAGVRDDRSSAGRAPMRG
jgi:hypothetical protein